MGRGGRSAKAGAGRRAKTPGVAATPGGPATGAGGMPTATAYAKDLAEQAKGLRGQAVQNYTQKKAEEAGKDQNDAAALEQFRDLLVDKEEIVRQAEGAGKPGANLFGD